MKYGHGQLTFISREDARWMKKTWSNYGYLGWAQLEIGNVPVNVGQHV